MNIKNAMSAFLRLLTQETRGDGTQKRKDTGMVYKFGYVG